MSFKSGYSTTELEVEQQVNPKYGLALLKRGFFLNYSSLSFDVPPISTL
jgi:hypothetical protein